MSRFFQDEGEPAQGTKICLATTSYGNPDAAYTFAIQGSREVLHKAGFQTAYYLLQGNCHVDDARNRVAQAFLKSDCTHLLFLDADVSWQPEALLALCRHDLPVVGGVYPKRRDTDEIPCRLLDGATPENGLLEVEGLPTGFLKISREALEKVAEVSESYNSDGETTHLIFQRTLENGTRWGGDLNFCNVWRRLGGKVYADVTLRLGHTGEQTITGSLGSLMRAKTRTTLMYVCQRIKDGEWTVEDIAEAADYVSNKWGADVSGLAACVSLAKKADGDIIEAGSGLTTILMAAATSHTVYCLEHHGLYAAKLRQMAAEAGVDNIGLCIVPIKGGFYDTSEFIGLPDKFAMGVVDGPPRPSSRQVFFEHFSPDVAVCDDVDEPGYLARVERAAEKHGYGVTLLEPRTAILCRPHATSLLARSA